MTTYERSVPHPIDVSASTTPSAGFGILPGTVCEQYVRCGKDTCACQDGKPHGPYYYRVWRAGGRVHKVYVKSEEVEAVVAACAAYAQLAGALRRLRRQRQEICGRLERDVRQAQRRQHRRKAEPVT